MHAMSKPLSPLALAAYAVPGLSLAALALPLYVIVPTFYTEVLGLPLAAVGLVLLGIRVFDALNDPLIGIIADGWRPRLGRRRAMFLISLPIAALAALMLFAPPADAGLGHLAFWASVLTIGQTGVFLTYSAWGAELADDYSGRSRIVAVREGLTLVGTLVAISLPFVIGLENADSWHGLAVLGIVVAIGLLTTGAAAVALVPEPRDRSTVSVRFRDALGAMRRKRPSLRLIVA